MKCSRPIICRLCVDEQSVQLNEQRQLTPWDTPWWHMLLLHEMGLSKEIPSTVVLKMVEALKHHYLPVFPIKEEEVPAGFEIPAVLEAEVKELVSRQMSSETLQLKRYNLFDKRSYNPNPDGSWVWGNASEFDLMKAVSFDGSICYSLSKKIQESAFGKTLKYSR